MLHVIGDPFAAPRPARVGILVRAFHAASVLKGLKALDSRARRKGLEALDPSRGALIPYRHGNRERTRGEKRLRRFRSRRGRPKSIPSGPPKIAAELDEIRDGLRSRASRSGKVPDLGRHGRLGRRQGDVSGGGFAAARAAAVSARFHRSGEARIHPRRYEKAQRAFRRAICCERTLVVGMAMGMTSYEPVVNLEKLAAAVRRGAASIRAPIFIT